MANQKDGLTRQQALQQIDDLECQASDCQKLVNLNREVLARQQQELEDAKVEAMKMILVKSDWNTHSKYWLKR